jgi:nicotinamidase-related amidase
MGPLILGVIVVVVLALVVLAAALHIVQQYERAVVFRFGRVTGEKGPGLVVIAPFVNVLRRVSFRIINAPACALVGAVMLVLTVVDRRLEGQPRPVGPRGDHQQGEDMTDLGPTIDPRCTVLLVMDYQSAALAAIDEPDALVARMAEAIAIFRSHGGHVGYVRVAFEDADYEAIPPTSGMGARVAAAGKAFHNSSPATAIHDDLAPQPGDLVVRKTRVGAFSTTDLGAQLRDHGITTLVLAGISTSGVVLSTVRDAYDRDYRVFVLADASADPDPEVHRFLTQKVFPRQADVITIAELKALLAAAGAAG